jgi:hypothetical protein
MWTPTKSEEQYEDHEVRESGVYKRLAPTGLADEQLLSITRDTIREMWSQVQITRYSDTIAEVFAVLEADEIEHGNEVLITRNERGVCKYKLTKGQNRKRFSHSNYQHFIGRGTPKDSDTYREAVKLLREKCGKDESALHGGFLLIKTQMRSDTKNGIFELVLETGKAANSNTDKFSAKLYQFPFVKQAVPTITFPPASGEKGPNATLQVTDTEQEVPSMSQMLKAAIVKGAQTPAVVFGLVELLKKETGEAAAAEESDSDGGSSNEVEVEAPRPTSAAHALLDDDDDE